MHANSKHLQINHFLAVRVRFAFSFWFYYTIFFSLLFILTGSLYSVVLQWMNCNVKFKKLHTLLIISHSKKSKRKKWKRKSKRCAKRENSINIFCRATIVACYCVRNETIAPLNGNCDREKNCIFRVSPIRFYYLFSSVNAVDNRSKECE